METLKLPGPSADDSDAIEETLEQLDSYIVAQVKKLAQSLSHFAHPSALFLEIDEIIQRVRIKFWKALQEKQIQYPQAYIQRIICNEFNDIARRGKPTLPLITDKDGETNYGKALITVSEGMDDPAYELEQKEAMADRLAEVAEVVSALPPRQKLAIILLLLERMDDVSQLVKALKVYQVNVEVTQWPENDADKHRLKASVSVVRQKMAQCMPAGAFVRKRRRA